MCWCLSKNCDNFVFWNVYSVDLFVVECFEIRFLKQVFHSRKCLLLNLRISADNNLIYWLLICIRNHIIMGLERLMH